MAITQAVRKTLQRAALSVCVVATAGAAQAETLADALVGAYNNSGLLDQNRALLRAADEDVAGAAAALKPVVNYTASVTRNFGDTRSISSLSGLASTNNIEATNASVGLVAELLLYDFGATQLGVEAAKETVLSTRQQLISIEQQVLLGAVSAFLNVRSLREFVALRRNNLNLLQQELRAAQDRFEVGEVTRTDGHSSEA